MSETDKTAETVNGTAAPAAAPATTTAPAAAAPSQPEKDKGTIPAPEAKSTETPTEEPAKETGPVAGLKKELFKLRTERREMREKMEKLEKLVQERSDKAPKPEEAPIGLFDDPEKRLEMERTKVKSELMSELKQMEAEKIRAEKIQAEGQLTVEELLKKPEVNGDMNSIEEIDEIIMSDPELSQIVNISPKIAGEKAFEIWAKEKGIDTESKKVAASAKTAAAAPASTPMTTKGKLTVADIKAMAAKLDYTAPDFKQKWEALMQEANSL